MSAVGGDAAAGVWSARALARGRWHATPVARADPPPLVAILCTAPRTRAAAAGVALALARALEAPCALAAAVHLGAASSLGGTPAARRTSAALRGRGLPVTAAGRLAWLADRRGCAEDDDVAVCAAALGAELGRAAAAVRAPAAVAIPFARTAALDRVLAWHDAIVAVREPDASEALHERVLASLAALGRPVAAMAPPPPLPGALAAAGLCAPAEAASAVAQLALGGPTGGRRGA